MNPAPYLQPVAWGEMDALGHVNNAVYFRYMESARVAFLLAAGIDRLRHADGVGVILQSAQCRFRRPVRYPDTLSITSVVESIGDDRFTLAHEMTSRSLGEVAAIGSGVIVAYDYTRGVKAPLPPAWRSALEAARGPSGPGPVRSS
ncbi:MAG: acyl-CoA thioesterase [Phycisphaeraceae bacterium]|nr:MAG: acyl-CoA thioesterase [Phycisphaeraceae bacterium]